MAIRFYDLVLRTRYISHLWRTGSVECSARAARRTAYEPHRYVCCSIRGCDTTGLLAQGGDMVFFKSAPGFKLSTSSDRTRVSLTASGTDNIGKTSTRRSINFTSHSPVTPARKSIPMGLASRPVKLCGVIVLVIALGGRFLKLQGRLRHQKTALWSAPVDPHSHDHGFQGSACVPVQATSRYPATTGSPVCGHVLGPSISPFVIRPFSWAL